MFPKMIFAVEAQTFPMIYEVNNLFIISLTCILNLYHAHNTPCAIETIEEFVFHWFQTINERRLMVRLPIESIDLKGAEKLFDQVISVCSNIILGLNEV